MTISRHLRKKWRSLSGLESQGQAALPLKAAYVTAKYEFLGLTKIVALKVPEYITAVKNYVKVKIKNQN